MEIEQVNIRIHMASYTLNPKWYDTERTRKMPLVVDREVMKQFFTTMEKIHHTRDEEAAIKAQFAQISYG